MTGGLAAASTAKATNNNKGNSSSSPSYANAVARSSNNDINTPKNGGNNGGTVNEGRSTTAASSSNGQQQQKRVTTTMSIATVWGGGRRQQTSTNIGTNPSKGSSSSSTTPIGTSSMTASSSVRQLRMKLMRQLSSSSLSRLIPSSMTFTAIVQCLQEPKVGQSVYLLDKEYFCRWLRWAVMQKVAPPPPLDPTTSNTSTTGLTNHGGTANMTTQQQKQQQQQQQQQQQLKKEINSFLQEAVRLISLQYGLSDFNNDILGGSNKQNGPMDRTGPGPIDSTSLSVAGYPLLLNPLVDVDDDLGTAQLNNPHYHQHQRHEKASSDTQTSAFPALPSNVTKAKSPPASKRGPAQRSVSLGANVGRTTASYVRNHHASIKKAMSSPADDDDEEYDDDDYVKCDHSKSRKIRCVAVPETFYETLRSVHGVMCDDGISVSFQPPAAPTTVVAHNHHHHQHHNRQHHHHHHSGGNTRGTRYRERLLLLHHLHDDKDRYDDDGGAGNGSNNGHNSNGHNNDCATTTTTNTTSSDNADDESPTTNNGGAHNIHPSNNRSFDSNDEDEETEYDDDDEYDDEDDDWMDDHTQRPNGRPIEFRRKVILQQQKLASWNEPLTLMEKLMLQERQIQNQSYMIPTVEIHPIKLEYSVVVPLPHPPAPSASPRRGNGTPGSLESSTTPVTQSVRGGFVLASRETCAMDALLELLRVAEPTKATECVRLWTRRSYHPNHRHQHNHMRRSTKRGDGYELVDWHSLREKKKQPQQQAQQQKQQQHHQQASKPENNNNGTERKSGSRMSLGEFVERHHIRKDDAKGITLLVETRNSVNSPWPREPLELASRIAVGDFVDAQDVAGRWYEAVVRQIHRTDNNDKSKRGTSGSFGSGRSASSSGDSITVHYVGWASKWDSKVRLRPGDGSTAPEGVVAKLQAPAPLWSRASRWRERLKVGDAVEVRDSSSIVERPKWYRGVVKKVGKPYDPLHDIVGGADLEEYEVDGDPSKRKEKLLLMGRTQQIMVEVDQEKSEKASVVLRPSATSALDGGGESGLKAQPPYIRWVNLYGEEICQMGTHLMEECKQGPVTLTYEYEEDRKPVEVLKSNHPMLGAGFMRESLLGAPPAPGSVGLHNLGNSCFLNSTVQCLNHIEPLSQFFVNDRFHDDLNKKNPLGSGGSVAVAYASLLKKMWGGEYAILAPRTLKQTVASFAPQFDNSYQHDSQEFCQFLMDGLHEDLNRVKTKPYVEELEGFGMEDQKAAIESWRKHLLRHDSIIVDHCQGMHRSHLTCPQCGRESIKFDVFSSISLPLAIASKDKNATSAATASSSIALEDCIEKFMEGEQLDERNAWYCPSCRKHVCALKMIALWSVPDILILHLKRFTFDTCMTSGSMLRSKIDDKVEFPIEGLDLTKHVLGPIDEKAPPIYKLFGVSEHTGPTANSGHYTATVRNSIDGQWYRCNDSHVGLTSGEASITGGAYLLFYQRSKGSSKWAGMEKVMAERSVNPYGGLETDQEGFTKVKAKKNKSKPQTTSAASRR